VWPPVPAPKLVPSAVPRPPAAGLLPNRLPVAGLAPKPAAEREGNCGQRREATPRPTASGRLTEGGGVGAGAQREGGLVAEEPGAGAEGRGGAGGGGAEPGGLVAEQTLLQKTRRVTEDVRVTRLHLNTPVTSPPTCAPTAPNPALGCPNSPVAAPKPAAVLGCAAPNRPPA